jgi:hypothetical protein
MRYETLLSSIRAACAAHPVLLGLIHGLLAYFGRTTYYEAPHSAIFSSPRLTSSDLDPNRFLSTLYSSTLNMCFFPLSVRNQNHTHIKHLSQLWLT